MFELIERIQAAETAEAASPLTEELERVSAEVRNGRDGNGDGRVTWQEGGLYQARHHMGLLVREEGLQDGEPAGQ
jgi:hypothetical protein